MMKRRMSALPALVLCCVTIGYRPRPRMITLSLNVIPEFARHRMSRHDRFKPASRYQPYTGAAGGWGALRSVTGHWLGSDNALKNIRALLKTNQHGGFDCPGCAWGESDESGPIKFCENGAKAVNW